MEKQIQLAPWQLFGIVITAIGVFLYYMSGFLTIREHQEFVTRFDKDISRIENVETLQNNRLSDIEKMGIKNQLKALGEQLERLSKREDERHLKQKNE